MRHAKTLSECAWSLLGFRVRVRASAGVRVGVRVRASVRVNARVGVLQKLLP